MIELQTMTPETAVFLTLMIVFACSTLVAMRRRKKLEKRLDILEIVNQENIHKVFSEARQANRQGGKCEAMADHMTSLQNANDWMRQRLENAERIGRIVQGVEDKYNKPIATGEEK